MGRALLSLSQGFLTLGRLIPLYIRAIESQRPDALLKDEKAVALATQMASAFSQIKQIKMDEEDRVAIILRNREFDRCARDFA